MSDPLIPLDEEQLNLAGDISICISNYTDSDVRQVAMANILAMAFAIAKGDKERSVLERAAKAAGFSFETL